MAQLQLASILVHTPPGGADFQAYDTVAIYWDNVSSAIVVKKNGADWPGSFAGAYFGELSTNYYISGITSYEDNYAISGYSFCSGSDLKWFKMPLSYPSFPYMQAQTTVNSPVCATGGTGAVCDIKFSGPPVITHATDRTVGGSITVTATSSNGTVKYARRNNAYADMTNTTGTFTGIAPGQWTVYAKDANDCTASINFKILYRPAELEHYRFTWKSAPIGSGTEYTGRVRIYEREYVGDVVEIDRGEESPFKLSKPKAGEINDKFYPVHPTTATLSLVSQQDYQFLPLFTQDNKKFRVVYEVDTGSGFTPVWQGFIIPSVYRENFISVPYTVEVEIVDNVKRLEQEPFTDDDGNLLFGSMKLIKVIAHIMKKTGLSLKIRSGINIFETRHAKTATDDPLDQTYIDVACYRDEDKPFDCWKVLESILKPFGARIYQCDNQWIIEEIDRAVTTYAYRVFSADGVYESNSTFNPIVDVKASTFTNRAALLDEDHSLEVIPAYGKIDITSKLNYTGSMVAGGFEKEDLLSPNSETFNTAQGVYMSEEGFRDWTLRHNGTTGVSFGRVVVGDTGDIRRRLSEDPDRSVGAFYYDADSWTGNLRNAYVESAAKPYQYGPNDSVRLSFEYYTPSRPEYNYMVLRVVLKVGNYYLQPDLTWRADESIYRTYPSISNTLQKFEVTVPCPDTTTVVDTTAQVRIYFYEKNFYDFGTPPTTNNPATGTEGITQLRALPTVSIDYDYKLDARAHVTTGSVTNYSRAFFELRISDVAEDMGAGILRPNDFNSSTNPKVWYSVGTFLENKPDINRRTRGRDRSFYIDDVALEALVNGQPAPEEETISKTISKYINESLEVDLYNFDLPDITNGKNMYNNYFRLSTGAPTATWARTTISEEKTLQEILLDVLEANHSAPTFRVTGSFVNEFSRIGINNYIRITKPGSSLVATNTTFASNLNGWSQSSFPLAPGTSWAWTADNSGSAAVTLNTTDDSKKMYQAITHTGGYITFTVNIKAIPASSSNTAEDVLYAVFYNGTSIIHTEKMQTFASVTSATTYDFTHIAFAPGQVTHIGFFIKRVSGSSSVTYQMGTFTPAGSAIQEVYQIADSTSEERMNTYFFELMQVSKPYITLGDIDKGGNSQGRTASGENAGFTTGFSLGLRS